MQPAGLAAAGVCALWTSAAQPLPSPPLREPPFAAAIRDAEGCALGTADDYLEAFAAAGFELVEHTDKTEFAKTALKGAMQASAECDPPTLAMIWPAEESHLSLCRDQPAHHLTQAARLALLRCRRI